LKKKKAPGLALKKKFKKNSDFWAYEKKIRFWIRKTVKKQWFYWFVIILVRGEHQNTTFTNLFLDYEVLKMASL